MHDFPFGGEYILDPDPFEVDQSATALAKQKMA
jgi:hypothetical protein